MENFKPGRNYRYQSYFKQIRGLYQKPIAQTSTALILTLATAAFFGLAAIKPTLSTVSQLMREIEDKKEVESKLSQKLTALSQAQEVYLQYQDKLSTLDIAIPPTQNIKLFLLQLEFLTWENKTPLESMQIQPLTLLSQIQETTPPADSFSSFTTTLTVWGKDRSEFYRLLQSFDTLDRIISVESVTFNLNDKENELYPLKMTTIIKTFWAPVSSPPSNADIKNQSS